MLRSGFALLLVLVAGCTGLKDDAERDTPDGAAHDAAAGRVGAGRDGSAGKGGRDASAGSGANPGDDANVGGSTGGSTAGGSGSEAGDGAASCQPGTYDDSAFDQACFQ